MARKVDSNLAPESSHSKLGLTLEDEEQGTKALSAGQTWQWVVEFSPGSSLPSHCWGWSHHHRPCFFTISSLMVTITQS